MQRITLKFLRGAVKVSCQKSDSFHVSIFVAVDVLAVVVVNGGYV